ncbi:hypothetical protein GCM10010964_18750 [Caldovatus sediminis]|uniref:Uncharacterized protein n=1 Tax=Caldovatus sediminis TaxID=2041189 RepID=A0A8J2ZAR3_9PROT|nr:phage GP46 family protein [Caldovatus sediminis]GGG31052.1 hypothetical protein GCM10010964_18750 [Caldovatus sediminis]
MPGPAVPIADLMLRHDPAARRCDLVVQDGDLALDRTAATAMLVSLGSDGRARADDALPDEPSATPAADAAEPAALAPRRGWCGDALDRRGRRIGCRLWLLERAKGGEQTRRRAEAYAAEGLDWLRAERGLALALAVDWARPGLLAITARAGTGPGAARITIRRPVAAPATAAEAGA